MTAKLFKRCSRTVALLLLGGISSIPALTIKAPKNWEKLPNPPAGIILQYQSTVAHEGFYPNLNILRTKPDSVLLSLKSPMEFAARMQSTQERLFPMFKVLQKEERQIGLARGALLVFKHAHGPHDYVAFEFSCIYKGEQVSLVYTCLASQFDALRSEFEQSLASLRWDP